MDDEGQGEWAVMWKGGKLSNPGENVERGGNKAGSIDLGEERKIP